MYYPVAEVPQGLQTVKRVTKHGKKHIETTNNYKQKLQIIKYPVFISFLLHGTWNRKCQACQRQIRTQIL